MASTQARIYFEGLPRLMKMLKEDAMLIGIWKDAMQEATSLGEESARKVAGEARGTGTMAARITSRLAATPVPRSGIVSVKTARGETRYPFILQGGTGKSKSVLHFRGSGKPTRGWMNRAIANVQKKINGILERAARQIEQRWERG